MKSPIRNKEKGATVIEYALIAALVSIAAIGAFSAVGGKVSETMNKVGDAMDTGGGGGGAAPVAP